MARFALAMLCLALAACSRSEAPPGGIAVQGGNMPALPPLAAQEARLEPAALEAAAILAREAGSDALLIARNGHLLLERYWHGTGFATPVAAGAWQRVIDDLLAGALANDRKPIDADGPPLSREALAQAAGTDFAAYLSKRLWRPIGAADAVLAPDLVAAQGDWIRIGELLANDGVYQGEEIVPPGWVPRLLGRRALPVDASTSPGLRDAWRLPGAEGACLWVVPALRLVVLRTGAAPGEENAAIDATILDAVMRGVADRPRAPGADGGVPDPSVFVPAH